MEAREPTKSTPPLRKPSHRCAVCRRPIAVSGPATDKRPSFFPFCCERCKLVDLGAWLDGDYRIPARPDDTSDGPSIEDAGG